MPASKVLDAANASLASATNAQGAEVGACCDSNKAQEVAKASGGCEPAVAAQAAKSCC